MNKTVNFDIKSAHRMVAEQRSLKNDVRWDGWDIVFHRTADHAMHSKDGAFRNGSWGFDNRVIVNSEGVWEVDERNLIKRPRHARNRRR